jgi:anti-sigma factor RsiW
MMNTDIHSRAWQLVLESRAGTIGQSERIWMEDHLLACAACRARANSVDEAIRSLRSVAVQLDPAVVEVTRMRVRARSREVGARRPPRLWLWLACALSWAWIAESGTLLWRGFAWLAGRFGVPSPIWQMTFALWWVLPALVVAAALGLRSLQGADSISDVGRVRL